MKLVARAREQTGIGRFELERPLGSGSSGTVFEARELSTGARVAIKVLREQSGTPLYQFKREFRALTELSHPNVVRFGELFEDAGHFYLTMELISGTDFLSYVRGHSADSCSHSRPNEPTDTLQEPIREEKAFMNARAVPHQAKQASVVGQLDTVRLREGLAQLCSGIIALHAAGFVHRDIKPQNVLVTDAGRVVLLDFGLAIGNLRQQRSFGLEGTVAYMAPEQALGLPVSDAADWYSVGVMLYEALTGRLPHGDLPFRKLSPSVEAVVPHPSSVVAGLPDDLCELCMALLERDSSQRPGEDVIASVFGLEPSEERARASFRSQVHFSRGNFVGREAELQSLREALIRASGRGCTLVRVQGESGVGKTALVRRFIEEVSGGPQAPLVFAGRCYERETVPCHGIDGVVDELAQHLRKSFDCEGPILPPRGATLLAAAFPVLRAVPGLVFTEPSELLKLDPHAARRQAFVSLREVLRTLSEKRPVIIHIDDAHWIDAESVSLLAFLTQRAAPRMLIVLTERFSRQDRLAELVGSTNDSTVLTVGPLSLENSKQLASALMATTKQHAALDPLAIARKSEGHPLFLYELVLHGAKDSGAEVNLEQAILARVDQLDEGSRRFLETVALAATPVSHEMARAASDLSPAAYGWMIHALRAENMIAFHAFAPDAEVQVYHDRVREVAVAAMHADLRRKIHHNLAFTIEAHAPDNVDAIAHHYLEAGVRNKAALYTQAAGRLALEKLAFERAARFFELALTLEDDISSRAKIAEQLGDALASCGRGQQAAEAYLAAATRFRTKGAVDLRRRAAEQFLRAGHLRRGTDILFGMLRELGFRVPEADLQILSSLMLAFFRLQVQLRKRAGTGRVRRELSSTERLLLDACWSAATGLSMVHHLRATYFQVCTLLLALEAGDQERVLKSAALLGASLSMADGFPRKLARSLLSLARQLTREFPSQENEAWLAMIMGAAAMAEWDFRKCQEYCGRAEALFRDSCPGASWEVVTSQAFTLWSMAFSGELREAGARLPELLESARARGDRHALATLVLSPLHLVGLAADEPERVRAECSSVLSEWPVEIACFQHMCGEYVLAQADLYDGRDKQAWGHALTAWRMLRKSHLSRVQFQRIDLLGLRARAALARAAAERGRLRAMWIRRADADAERLADEGLIAATAIGAIVKAAALCARGRHDQAILPLGSAREQFELQGMLLHAWIASLGRAIVCRSRAEEADAELALRSMGVTNPHRMLRLWLPTISIENFPRS